MSDMSSGARAPDYPVAETYPATYPATSPATETYPAGGTYADGGEDSKAKQVAGQAKQVAGQAQEAAGQAASEVKDTAKEQAQRVGAEAKTQVRNVAADVRGKVSDQARTQNDKLVGTIRDTAAQLDEMRGDRGDSPAAAVVSRVADGGRQIADYLDRNGPEGVLREVQDFARRRPGAFLATALAAGFVVGRLGKGVAKADPDAGETKPASDSFVSTSPSYTPEPAYPATGYTAEPGYASSTEYASTGTGTPVVVEEEFVFDNPERRP
jgi:uncharacterized protein YjbJ (UPF0337 family)